MPVGYKQSLQAARISKEVEVANFLLERPDLNYDVIAKTFGVSRWLIKRIAKKYSITRPYGPKPKSVAAFRLDNIEVKPENVNE
jgi:hypothetical protein